VSRAISTAVDVAVFLLLVSAAASTLTLPAGTGSDPTVEPSADVLAHTTASVEYSLAAGAEDDERFPRVDGRFDRNAHGRLASLFARAGTRTITVDGERITRTGDGFARVVERAVSNATGPRTQVLVRWHPYEGSTIVGRARAGVDPPRDATVASRTLTIETNAVGARGRARAAANRSGYPGVARVLANATVAVLLPERGMANALAADYPTDRLAEQRYRNAAALFGTNVSEPLAAGDATGANDRIRTALAERFESRLRARFGSPRTAADAVQAGDVRVVVRRWDA
jgi:hypothetical protein